MKKKILPCLLAALSSSTCLADDTIMHRILLDGTRINLLGLTESASSGTATQKKIEAMVISRPGEILEVVPGVIVSQHSGEGKANQFFLRGFNLDHGTDLRTNLDDMPVNQRSHAHGQGWTDLNFIIPELVGRLDYRKGPYFSSTGDFSSAGATQITYANRLPQGQATLAYGANGYRRTLLTDSPDYAGGQVLYAIETLNNDGPFTHPDRYKKLNGVLKYSQGFSNNGFSLSAMAYKAKWNATDQIPLRAVQAGELGRFDAIDTSDGGEAQRYSLSGTWRRSDSDQASKISAFMIRNQSDLYSNFTYFLNDPIRGDQFNQPDRRVTTGLNASHTWHTHNPNSNDDITVGMQVQNDLIFNGLHLTEQRVRHASVRSDKIQEANASFYVDWSRTWHPQIRTQIGLRQDNYRFKIESDRAENSGVQSENLISPSFNMIYLVRPDTEIFFNLGRGFHSNDARATTLRIDPASLEATQSAPGLVRSFGKEIGIRTEFIPKLSTSLAVFQLDFDSELQYLGDAGTTEAGPPSHRIGMEWTNQWQINEQVSLELSTAFAKARSRHTPKAESYLPGAIEGVTQMTLQLAKMGPWSGSLRLRHLGPRALTEDNSVRSKSSTTLNGRIGYRWNKQWAMEIEAMNLSNRAVSAIDYYYESRLKNESKSQSDIHFHPMEGRSLRVQLHYLF